jgi:hypothetical protein
MSSADDGFEQRVKDDLQKIVAGTSPELRARIDAIAATAAREAREPRRRFMPVLIPVGGVAAMLMAIVAVQLLKQRPLPSEKLEPIAPDDVALLLNVDNLDLLDQLEFYQWLDRDPGVLDAADAAAPKLPRRS